MAGGGCSLEDSNSSPPWVVAALRSITPSWNATVRNVIRVVTDGAADLPFDLAARLKIEVVRGPVRLDGNHWEGDPSQFWGLLRRGERLPATDAPAVADLSASYKNDGPVMAVHVSGELSRTVAHASAAAADATKNTRR